MQERRAQKRLQHAHLQTDLSQSSEQRLWSLVTFGQTVTCIPPISTTWTRSLSVRPFFPAICYRKQKQVFNKKALCATSVTLPPARFGTLELCFWWSTRRCMVIAFSIARTSLSDLSLQASEPNIPPTRSPSTRRWPLESPLRRSEGLFGLFVTPVNCHELSLPPTVIQSCLRIFTVTPNAQDLQKYDLMLVSSSNKIISGFQLLPLDPGPSSTRFSQDPGRC